jgi:N-carbamoyl-L-amino-acid hydrolase
MILRAREIGLARRPEARVTVGRISVPSDSHSVVPGLAEFTLDLRHPEEEGLDRLERECRAAFAGIAAAEALELRFEPIWSFPPVAFDATLRERIASAATARGLPIASLPSRAGHDAWNLAHVTASAMIFIPSRDGISHAEAEHSEFDHIADAADVLLDTVVATAGRADPPRSQPPTG